mmetsp:Transcript_25836/g.52305  ORF Transcript_25836/g.52305 Transcript_25836/m.52305 type:complete len:446 (+) Transcript_25836:1725-3062(+)
MQLVSRLQSTKNTDRILRTRLIHHNLLESTFQRLILLNKLPILINCRGTNTPKLSPRQSRFKKIRRIHRSRSGSRPYDRVHFVDKKNHFPIALLYFVNDALETFFEFSSHGGSGHEGTHVQSDETTGWFERVGDVSGYHSLGDSFGYGGFSNTGVTDQNWIVLGSPTQNLDRPANFVISSNYRVQLSLLGPGSEIDPIFLQSIVISLGTPRRDPSSAPGLFPHGPQCLFDVIVGNVLAFERSDGEEIVFGAEADEEGFGGYIGVLQFGLNLPPLLQNLRQSPPQTLLRLRSVLVIVHNDFGLFVQMEFHLGLELGQVDSRVFEYFGGYSFGGDGSLLGPVLGGIEQDAQQHGSLHGRGLIVIGTSREGRHGRPCGFRVFRLVEVFFCHGQSRLALSLMAANIEVVDAASDEAVLDGWRNHHVEVGGVSGGFSDCREGVRDEGISV